MYSDWIMNNPTHLFLECEYCETTNMFLIENKAILCMACGAPIKIKENKTPKRRVTHEPHWMDGGVSIMSSPYFAKW